MNELKPILLAEDSDLDAELTMTSLAELQLANELVRVSDGAEALNFVYRRGAYAGRDSSDPLVLLLDLKMPRVDGLEVLKQVRADDALNSLPVVMVTSSREERDLVASYRLGANAYVVKPVDSDQFTKTVKTLGLFWAVVNATPRRRAP